MRCRIQALDRRQGGTAPPFNLGPTLISCRVKMRLTSGDRISLFEPCGIRGSASPGLAGFNFTKGKPPIRRRGGPFGRTPHMAG